jgi:hypothetical protein
MRCFTGSLIHKIGGEKPKIYQTEKFQKALIIVREALIKGSSVIAKTPDFCGQKACIELEITFRDARRKSALLRAAY